MSEADSRVTPPDCIKKHYYPQWSARLQIQKPSSAKSPQARCTELRQMLIPRANFNRNLPRTRGQQLRRWISPSPLPHSEIQRWVIPVDSVLSGPTIRGRENADKSIEFLDSGIARWSQNLSRSLLQIWNHQMAAKPITQLKFRFFGWGVRVNWKIDKRWWCDEWWNDDVWCGLGFGVAWDLVGQEPQVTWLRTCQCVTKARQGSALLGRSQSLRSLDKEGWRGSLRGTLGFVGSWWCLEAHCGAVYMLGKLGILSPTLLHSPFENLHLINILYNIPHLVSMVGENRQLVTDEPVEFDK